MTPSALDSSAIPFTQAQVEFLAVRELELEKVREQRERNHRRRWRNANLAGFLILLAGVGGGFYTQGQDRSAADSKATEQRIAIVDSGRAVSVAGCNRDFKTISKLRGILIRGQEFQRAAFERGDISIEVYERGTAYYQQQLGTLPVPDCRKAAKVLTSDPNAPIRVPEPLHATRPTHGNP